jgi:hypothetical protein
VVLFTHAGWREPVEFMHHCSTKWAGFLLSLKGWIERAEGRPHPYDVKVHPGDRGRQPSTNALRRFRASSHSWEMRSR